ncbi:LAGLIDADG family homing endonuclease [Halopenitus sp. POP-27]|uniref:LAGLIDADG family homing endonuclease n=1 Tax=Halopenitus sp. POP-27 TaxID=2994425 RepID=UPI00246835DF|nr:LAGLIDADG family homing endonuclease [Halopenitus sp. POP-27]
MAQAGNQDLTERFIQFYRNYYREAVGELAQRYPNEQRSLYIDYDDLYQFDRDLAEDFRSQPEQLREYAEEALRLYDLPADVSLGRAHVRIQNLPDSTDIRGIRVHDDHIGTLVSVQGIVRKATDVRPKITDAAFECQRCGTMTYIPQSDGGFQEPHECQGCERQGPFRVNFDQSEFVDSQKLRIQESPEGLRGGETPQAIDVNVVDDITGKVTPGDHVTAVGVLHIEQVEQGNEKSAIFDLYMDGVSITVEDEQFEDMDITTDDVEEIIELSNDPDVYGRMTDSIAPAIYGYEEEKLAMILQLFSGVTKHLPDGSRIRGDLHMLLIGDPGTGKCLDGDTCVTLGDGRERPIREVVEDNLQDPKPIDDGVFDTVDFEVPSLGSDGTIGSASATKVWKREAPETMYRIETASGHELDVTPSHPLFVQPDVGTHDPRRAEELDVGDHVAVAPRTVTDGGTKATDTSKAGGFTHAVRWDRIESIGTVEPEDDWVYDLEIAGTHNYVSNGVISHNSQMISYVENIAPRSVYTSGKGSSAAGLCVTGDTTIHTAEGFVPIRDLASEYHPNPVDTETSREADYDLYTFDRESGAVELAESSHVWRMPEKPCRRIETAHGKDLEASVNTPVLVCDADGIGWRDISDVDPGDHVAVPKYTDVKRSTPPVREYVEFTEEKLKPTTAAIEFLRTRLREEFGTLRAAAAELGLTEDVIYDTLSNRHLSLETLETIVNAIGADIDDVDVDRAMLRHGDGVAIPEEFDADLLYLIGLVFGDGDVMVSRRDENRGHVRLSNSDEELLEHAAEIIEAKFDKSVDIERQDDRVPCIRLHSATVARFFSNVGVESPKDDVSLDPGLTTAEHADAFLQGLFDADGSVCGRDDGGSSVQFSTVCRDLAEQVQLMLETYGVRARTRDRDRRGTYERADGHEIESTSIQTHLAIYGKELDAFADRIGFRSTAKSTALDGIVRDAPRRGERLPIGDALTRADGGTSAYWQNLNRGNDPSRDRALSIVDALDLGDVGPVVAEVAEADLVWDEVVAAENTGEKEVFDLTVPDTHNFLANGLVTHNTAAAVRDDFGDGQQWSLEAGALVLADKGIAAVDELDKMESSDRSAMHEGLEQQKISVSKAGINATLKARCSLLGAANPKYGRFDQYEPIGEQIDLEPALISRFDLIFTVTDQPDPEHDSRLAKHILKTNYAGELNTQREELTTSEFTQAEVDAVTEEVAPAIDADLLRKYIAYAKRNCYPTMTDEAKAVIEEFYVDLRSKGADEDAPVPVTARKLEALVRLAEASARVRLSDTVDREDADRATDIVESCLKDIGVDPETGQFDADVVETGTSKSQRDRIKNLKALIADIEQDYEEGAPVEEVIDRADEVGMDPSKAEDEIEKLRRKGEVYEPTQNHLRTT